VTVTLNGVAMSVAISAVLDRNHFRDTAVGIAYGKDRGRKREGSQAVFKKRRGR
jgi:hypothetical protein